MPTIGYTVCGTCCENTCGSDTRASWFGRVVAAELKELLGTYQAARTRPSEVEVAQVEELGSGSAKNGGCNVAPTSQANSGVMLVVDLLLRKI